MEDASGFIGRVFEGRYRIEAEVARSPLAVVYRAVHLTMQHLVTLKVLTEKVPAEDVRTARFTSDIRASSRLKHPNSVRVFDGGRAEDGHLYVASEYLEGETLAGLMAREGPLPFLRAATIARQAAKSLGEAHENGLVHRDLKPDNLFLCEIFGEKDFVKVLDYGIARFIHDPASAGTESRGDTILGTPLYLSPEQAMGHDVDPRTDLYALGAILYEMLTGRPPFQGPSPIAIAMKHVREEVPGFASVRPAQNVPPALEDLVLRLLAKERDRRPPTAEAFLVALDAAVMGLPPPAPANRPESRVTHDWGTASPVVSAPVVPAPLDDDEEGIVFATVAPPAAAPSTGDAPDLLEVVQLPAGIGLPVTAPEPVRPTVGSVLRTLSPSWVLAAALAALLVAGGAWFLLADRGAPAIPVPAPSSAPAVAAAPATPEAPAAPASSAAATVAGAAPAAPAASPVPPANAPAGTPSPVVIHASILSVPSGAEVSIDGKVSGHTPYAARLVDGDPPVRLVLQLADYKPYEVTLDPRDLIASGRTSFTFDLVSQRSPSRKASPASPTTRDRPALEPKAQSVPSPVATPPRPRPEAAPKPQKKPVLNWDE